MKKFGSIKMHDANMMSDDEMKRILGGDLSTTTRTSCSTLCSNGDTLWITDCIGTCTGGEGYVKCKGPNNTLIKECPTVTVE